MTNEEKNPVRVALVGLGGWGRNLADAMKSCSSLTLAMGYDPNAENGERFAERYGIPTTQAANDLADDSIEALIVATPNTSHTDWTRFACQYGKGVYVEKPIAATVQEAQEMKREAEAAGVTLMVGHNTRRYAGHRQLKRLLAEGALGTIVMAEANQSHAGGMGLTGSEWRASREECPAIGLMQLGVHHADTLQWLLGPVSEVTALFAHVAAPVPIEDATLSLLRFESGPLGYLGSNYATPSRFAIALYGTRANAFCEHGGAILFQPAGGERRTLGDGAGDGPATLVEELEEFAHCVRTGSRPETDAEAGIRALAVIEAAIVSAAERRTVTIAEVLK